MTHPQRTSNPPASPRIGLFVTCLVDSMRPSVGFAALKLLRDAGCRVEVPDAQTCCGQPAFNSGDTADAAVLARHFIETFEGYDYVVAPSGSCVGSVREQHPGIAEHASDGALAGRVAEVAPKVYELSEFLVDVLGVVDVGAYFPHRVTYHPTCHSLRMLRVGDRPLRLLRAVRCGIGVPGPAGSLGGRAARSGPTQKRRMYANPAWG